MRPATARPRAALVANPAAGSIEADLIERVVERLASSHEVVAYPVGPSRDPAACARAAIADGSTLVIAAGGDGTVSGVAAALVGGEVPLAILPRGTANSVAGALGIPAELDEACAVIRADHRRVLDTARAGDRAMVLHCSIGLHAETIGETPPEQKRRWGALAYLATGLSKLADPRPFEVEMDTGAHVIRCRAVSITVANLAPIKTVVAQGPASVDGDDGLLDVTVLAPSSLAQAVAAGVHLLRGARKGEAATRDDIGYFACRRLRVVADPAQPILIDGEAAGLTPVEIVCRPASLVVVAPPAEPAPPSDAPDAKLDGLPGLEIEPR